MDLTKSVLDACEIAWAFLDSDQCIIEFNPKFQKYHTDKHKLQECHINEIALETVGLETIFQDMISGTIASYSMSHVQKEINTKPYYFNIIFIATRIAEKPLLMLLFDETDLALMHQKLQQQAYELKMAKALLHKQNAVLAETMIGASKPIVQLKNMIDKIARAPRSTILIQGETGTGKNLVARMIHLMTEKKERPFVEFNCAAVPESLLESELFGHEKGAFTHAITQKKGLMEEAQGGTLFLDEIGDIPLNLQAKLLTVLESRKFRRIGSTRELSSEFRLIAATHRDLKSMVESGSFREDLYYRIQVVSLFCPPLRELGDDIIQLARHFIQIYNREFGKHVMEIAPEVENRLKSHLWPGNVRELRNVIERAMIFIEGPCVNTIDIQLYPVKGGSEKQNMILPDEGISFEELEKQFLKQALERTEGNQTQAARLLKMSRDTFRYRLEKHHMLE